MIRKTAICMFLICGCIALPLFLEWITTPSPLERKIHIEAFRYGTSPSIIRANRGDELVLTFSTRDTGHSLFLQDYGIDVKISPAHETVEVRDPLRPGEPPKDVSEVRLKAGLQGLWGSLVSVSRFRCHVYCGPMHGFEQGDLIVRPNWLFTGSMGVLALMVILTLMNGPRSNVPTRYKGRPPLDLNRRSKFMARLITSRHLQFLCTLPLLAGLILAIFAGLFGTKVGGRNIAVMFTWVAWMSLLTLVLVPLGGRAWCMICPLPVLGEYLQRGATTQVRPGGSGRFANRFFGLGRRWPERLQGPWLRLFVFMGLTTFSASLAGQPRWTGLTLLVMAMAAVVMSLIWELRAFCRFICPVAAYISPYSVTGRLMVRQRSEDVCRGCREMACIRGNARGWACPYGLSVARIERNAECGLCTECFKTCPHDNVSLAWRKGPWTDTFTSYGESWQVISLLVLAAVSSLTVHSPWTSLRDMVNVVDKATWFEFGLYSGAVWTLALGLVPLLFWFAGRVGIWLSIPSPLQTGPVFKKTMPALIPLGLSLWACFFVATIMVNATFVVMTLSDPFGWGWDLLGTAGMPWVQIWPNGIPWIQAGLTLLGTGLSLKKGASFWLGMTGERKAGLRGFAPTGGLLVAFSGGMLTYFTQF